MKDIPMLTLDAIREQHEKDKNTSLENGLPNIDCKNCINNRLLNDVETFDTHRFCTQWVEVVPATHLCTKFEFKGFGLVESETLMLNDENFFEYIKQLQWI